MQPNPENQDLLKLQHLVALAIQHQNASQFDKAEESYRKIVALVPGWAEAQSNLGNVLKEQGKLEEAGQWYQQALVLKPDLAEIHYNLGNVLKDQGKLQQAGARYEKAIALKPDYAEAHNNLGIVLQLQKKLDEAVAQFELALALKPENSEALNNLGTALQEQRRLKEAAESYQQALALKPDSAVMHNNLGTVLKELGELKKAAAQYEKALAIEPDYAEAHYNRAELVTFRQGDANLAALEALASGIEGQHQAARTYIHFALGKALDDIGDYTRAFEHLAKGNALKRQEIDYDEALTQKAFGLIREVFSAEMFNRFSDAGDPSPVPIFVLGMPRSGSTLIEQILATHPQVQGAGELSNLNLIANGGANPYPACISSLDADGLRRLGKAYVASLPETPPGKTRITDKSPLNFLHVGLIRLILPNARIIHTVRDPVETCMSCFSKLFTFDMKFTYSLAELGRYYRSYSELMGHWRSVLPSNAMLEVSYEDVVANLEEQARRLLDYCELPWDDRCLSFHKTTRPVTTASAVQVRQPLFRSSLNRWHRYKDYLQPLLTELDPVMVQAARASRSGEN